MVFHARPGYVPVLAALALMGAGHGARAQNTPIMSVPLSFDSGFVFLTNDSVYPPDSMGAAGLNQYVQLINGGYGIYNKADGTPIGTLKSDAYFWIAAGVPIRLVTAGITDPRLLFDPTTQRWFATELTLPGVDPQGQLVPNKILLAVSKDGDPSDGFRGYVFDPNSGTNSQSLNADFDMLGLDSQNVTISAPLFDSSGDNAGADLLTVSKSDLLLGAAAPDATLLYNVDSVLVGQVPHPIVDLDGGAGAFFLADDRTPGGTNTLSRLAGETVSGQSVAVSPYHSPPDAREPDGFGGVHTGVNTNDPRYSAAVLKYHGIIYGAQSVQDPLTGAVDIRLVGIDAATGRAVLDKLIGDPAGQLDYYFPSLAINAAGQMVIGFSASGPLLYPSAFALAGQLDPAGDTVTLGMPQLLRAGNAAWLGGRWGDYSATAVDPTDPSAFWTTQEVAYQAPGTGNVWTTTISQVRLSPSGSPAVPEAPPIALLALGLLPLGGLILRGCRSRR